MWIPQWLASVGLDRPLLRLRLTPRRRVTAAAPGGGGTPPPPGGGTETVPLQERQNGTGYNQPVEGGGGPLQPPNGGGWRNWPTAPRKGREKHLSSWQVEEELLHLLVTEVVMGMMTMEGGDRPPSPRRNGGNGGDGDGDGSGGDDSLPPSDQGQPQCHQESKEQMGICGTRTIQTPRSTRTRWKG